MRFVLLVAVVLVLPACPPPVVGEGCEGGCGDVVIVGTTITNSEGLVVARDGTVFYSQPEAVGRRTPDGVVDDAWVVVAGADTLWGVMLSPDNQRLYAASPSTGSVFVIDVNAGVLAFEIPGFEGPNGLTVDAAGTLFVSDFFANAVFALDVRSSAADTVQRTVTLQVITPNGLLVDGDDLLVLGYQGGGLHRLVGGRIGAPGAVTTEASGLGNPDGM